MKKDPSCDCSYVTETEIYLYNLVLDSDVLDEECAYIGNALDHLFDALDMYDTAWKITLDYSFFCIGDFPKNLSKFTELNYLFIDISRDQIPDIAQGNIPSSVRNLVLIGYGDCDLFSLINLEYVIVSGRFITEIDACPKLKTIIKHYDQYNDYNLSPAWIERIKRDNIDYDQTTQCGCFL